MSIYIPNIELPRPEKTGRIALILGADGTVDVYKATGQLLERYLCTVKAVEVPPHGRLGDMDEIWELLEEEKYPETQIDNETDSDDRLWMIGKNAGINAFRRVCQKLKNIIPADQEEAEDAMKEANDG